MSSSPFPPDPLADRLLDHRVVALAGELDAEAANRAAAALALLGGQRDDPVLLQLSDLTADLDPALTVVDAIDLTWAPVHATCLGTLTGAAVALVAVADRRVAGRHATLQLREPAPPGDVHGDVHSRAEHHRRALRGLQERLAHACGRPPDAVAADMRDQRILSAREAQEYGLVDGVTGRGPPPQESTRIWNG